MGPPFITAEWLPRLRRIIPRWVRFNGAAVHHGGVEIYSWSRPTVLILASMGPPFITAEWLPLRRSSTSFLDGFNGAAVHHGGVGQTLLPGASLVSPLQ